MFYIIHITSVDLPRYCSWFRRFAFPCTEGLPLRPFRPFVFSWRSCKKFSQLIEVQPWWKSIRFHTDAFKWWGNTCY